MQTSHFIHRNYLVFQQFFDNRTSSPQCHYWYHLTIFFSVTSCCNIICPFALSKLENRHIFCHNISRLTHERSTHTKMFSYDNNESKETSASRWEVSWKFPQALRHIETHVASNSLGAGRLIKRALYAPLNQVYYNFPRSSLREAAKENKSCGQSGREISARVQHTFSRSIKLFCFPKAPPGGSHSPSPFSLIFSSSRCVPNLQFRRAARSAVGSTLLIRSFD